MKTFRVSLAFILLTGVFARAQDTVPPPTADTDIASDNARRTVDELDRLLAPIALYPDALIALILPASTVPADVVLAARLLRDNPDDRAAQVEQAAWDESVKSLTNYPEVLAWMDENLPWTKQLGEAFVAQPADVMQAVQRLRAKARVAGTLVDTPQQQVITEPHVIRIVPAQPDVIYVPSYDPDIVFYGSPYYYGYPQPFLTFGIGVAVGSWLAFDCDWHRHTIWAGDRHRRWLAHDWRFPVVPILPPHSRTRPATVHQWRPPPRAVRPPFSVAQNFRAQVVHPRPIGVNPMQLNSPRGLGFTDRSRGDGVRGITPPSRTFPSHRPTQNSGLPGTPRISAPANVVAPVIPPVVASPNSPAPGRRTPSGWSAQGDARNRSFHGAPINPAPALPAVSPSPRMPGAQFSRPAATLPRTSSAPQFVPAQPMVGRSSAPMNVAPAPQPPPAPAAQPAPQRGGESHGGHRGGGRER